MSLIKVILDLSVVALSICQSFCTFAVVFSPFFAIVFLSVCLFVCASRCTFIHIFHFFLPQTPLLAKWLPYRTSMRTHRLETSLAATQLTCSWGSEWRGQWLPCTGESKERSSRWILDHWRSPSRSSPSSRSSACPCYCSDAGPPSAESSAARKCPAS